MSYWVIALVCVILGGIGAILGRTVRGPRRGLFRASAWIFFAAALLMALLAMAMTQPR